VSRVYPLDAEDRSLPVTVAVVRGDVVNAYATLGGHIYVFDGLLQQAQSPQELAGVIAHEIAHVRDRHIIQGVVVNLVTFTGLRAVFPGGAGDRAGAAQTLLSLRFSREQEAEADRDGLARLRVAKVDASGLASFFARAQHAAQPPPFLSNHPSNRSRADLAASEGAYPSAPLLDAASWRSLKRLCQ
jgi:predicted Zn-dependent protease